MFYLIDVNSTRARVQSPVSVIFIFEISNPGWPISMARENIRVRPTRWEWLQYNFGRRRVARVVREIPLKRLPLQVSIEHYETRRQTMQADYRSSFAQVGNRIGDENFMHMFPDNAMPVSKDPPPEPSLTSPQFNAADSLDVPGQTLETLCVVFQNLPVETTIDDVAEKLRAPPCEGGCGVSISSSAILLSLDCVSFVVWI